MNINEYISKGLYISKTYNLPIDLVYTIIDGLEIRREYRQQPQDLEKSFSTLERWCRITKNKSNKNGK